MICFKLQRGASHVSLSQEARKGKKHGQIRVKLLFIKYDDTFCRVLSNFSRNLCVDHFLTTKKCSCF